MSCKGYTEVSSTSNCQMIIPFMSDLHSILYTNCDIFVVYIYSVIQQNLYIYVYLFCQMKTEKDNTLTTKFYDRSKLVKGADQASSGAKGSSLSIGDAAFAPF